MQSYMNISESYVFISKKEADKNTKVKIWDFLKKDNDFLIFQYEYHIRKG
jgi:hypothetical protein